MRPLLQVRRSKQARRAGTALVVGGLCLGAMPALEHTASEPGAPVVSREEWSWREDWRWQEALEVARSPGALAGKRSWTYPKPPETLEAAGTPLKVVPSFQPPPNFLSSVNSESSPVFADIDADGDFDAFIGAESGNTYFSKNTGTDSNPAFVAPLESPFGLQDVGSNSSPEFADIDADGDLDAFIGVKGGSIYFFENNGTPSSPAFAAFQTDSFGLQDVGSYTNPTFADIDADGDLDAFIGRGGGDTLFFENTGTPTSPAFATPVVNPFGLRMLGQRSSPEFVDIDADGDLDAVIGVGNIQIFENTGTPSSPAFAAFQTDPFGLRSAGATSHPAFADIDADGDVDAFIGGGGGRTFFFENTGSPANPAFVDLANPFGLTDVRLYSRPTFADIDADGDLDVFIGQGTGDTSFFENTGSQTRPAFADPQHNPFGLIRSVNASRPTFADIDADGDLDAFMGARFNIFFFENTGTPSSPAFADPQTNPFGLQEVGARHDPTFADIDADGDLDAFIGSADGWTIFFENTGTPTSPAFTLRPANPFGLQDVGDDSNPAFADIDADGDFDAFIGEREGNTLFFENTGTPTHPAFTLRPANPFGLQDVGVRSSPTFADIDADGDLDAFIGQDAGRTFFFENVPVEDTAPPVCQIQKVDTGPPTRLTIHTQDSGSGLASINVLTARNANLSGHTGFSTGTTSPVLVTATKGDERRAATVVLEVIDVAGNTTTCDPVVQTIEAELPEAFALVQNYPNPFNPSTRIRFELAEAAAVHLTVYDVLGRRVVTLMEATMEAGTYEALWDGRSDAGVAVAGGTYVYRLEAGPFTATKTMTLLR